MEDLKMAAVVDDLWVSFGGKPALKGLSLEIPRAEITVILGRSGAGKTTLLRSFNRLNECFDNCETRGSVKLFLDGRLLDVHHEVASLTQFRRKVGMVFQSPNILPVSIEKNLFLTLRMAENSSGENLHERMEKVLLAVDLWDEVKDRLRQPAQTLSGGQQQRLCLARTLTLEPEVLLLDEPTSSLDFQATRKIEQLLLTLRQRYTIIAVSHCLSQARRLADHIIVLQDQTKAHALKKTDCENAEILEKVVEEIF